MNGRTVTLLVALGALVLLAAAMLLWPEDDGLSIDLSDAALADLDRFVAALDQADRPAVRQAMRALPQRQPRRAGEVFTAVLDKSRKPDVREAALVGWRTAGRVDPGVVVRVLAQDEAEKVRSQAARTIAQQDHWDSVPALLRALRDPSRMVRAAAHGAVVDMLGADFKYRPDGDPREWDAAVRQYEQHWRVMGEYRDLPNG